MSHFNSGSVYEIRMMKRRKTRTNSEAGSSALTSPPEKKAAKTTSSASASAVKKTPNPPTDTKTTPLNIEEAEMEKRDAAKDVDLFQSVCGEISKLVEEIQDLKKQGKEATVGFYCGVAIH